MHSHHQPAPSCAGYAEALASPGSARVQCPACSAPTRDSEVLSRLPVLPERNHLPEWDAYLRRVYGDDDPPTYPIDLARLTWLYYDHLPIKLVPAQRAPQCSSVYGHAWISPIDCAFPSSRIGAFGAFIQHYHPTTGLRSPTHLHGARRRSTRGAAGNSWVEIARTSSNHALERCSYWYFHAPGSGIWWNVGKTYVANVTEDENHWFPVPLTYQFGKFVRMHSSLSCHGSEALRRLIKEGYASLQIPDITNHDLTNHFELIDLRNWRLKGGNASLPKCSRGHDDYRSGFNASRKCTCYSIESRIGQAQAGIIGCRELPVRNCAPRSAFHSATVDGSTVEGQQRTML